MNDTDKLRMYAESMNRRQLLRYGVAAGAAGLAGCAGGGSNGGGGSGGDGGGGSGSGGGGSSGGETGTSGGGGQYSEKVQLSLAAPTIGLPVEDPIGQDFMNTYNVDMSLKSVPATPAEMVQLFVAGNGQEQFDAIWDNGGGMEDLLGSRDALTEIDPSKIPNWDNLAEPFKEGGYLRDTMEYDGTLVGAPSSRNADSIAYLADEIDGIDSWGVVFNDEYKGRTALIDDYANTPHWTALYLRENNRDEVHNADILNDSEWEAVNNIEGNEISNLDEAQLKAVINYLIGQKKMGQFRTVWQSFGNISNMLQNGEILASYAYEPSVVSLRKQGVNIGYPAMREGNFEWDDHWYMTAGAANRGRQEGYYRLATYSCTPKYGALMNDTRGFSTGLSHEACLQYAKENWSQERYERNQQLFADREKRFQANGDVHAWNNPNPDLLDTYLEEWNRFLNA